MTEENSHLLQQFGDIPHFTEEAWWKSPLRSEVKIWVRWVGWAGIQVVLILLYTVASWGIVVRLRCQPTTALCQPSYALPDLRSRYLPQAFENPPVANSTYAGPPTPDRDQSWREFMLPMNLRVRQEELEDLSAPAVQLPGGGYLARLGVFHEVHCLAFLRQWNHRSYYYPELTTEGLRYWTNHADHCLELLRQSSVCHADAAIQTFRWDGHVPEPQLDVANEATHMCVDWDELMDSMRNRIVPTEEMAQLNNPLLSSSP